MSFAVLCPDNEHQWKVHAVKHVLDEERGFWDIYEDSFIKEEREPRSVIRSMAASDNALVCSFRNDGETVGICTVELLQSLCCGFIIYLALKRGFRGCGYGSSIAGSVLDARTYRDAGMRIPEHFILEVEHPDHAPDERQREVRNKRMQFFSKASLHPLCSNYLQPPLYDGSPVLPMMLLASRDWRASPEETVKALYKEKYQRVNGIPPVVLEKLFKESFGFHHTY